MPATRDRFIARLSKKFRQASEDRKRVLDIIEADPTLRQRLRKMEQAELEGPKGAKRSPASPSDRKAAGLDRSPARNAEGRVAITPKPVLENQALYVVGLTRAERLAKEAYQRAVWYYKWGDWKRDSVPVEEVGRLITRLKRDLMRARADRASAQEAFEEAARVSAPPETHHVLYREELLASVPPDEKGTSVRNAFERWLDGRTGKIEPDRVQDEPQL
ncbi:hypothetical protein [Methyloligella solikamskensis]|uniref:Uncharacterized protein n=1 Tax=Methyloligella solikamskensis TaxID=1177756 RepID=A0ABW3J769_9HYPH